MKTTIMSRLTANALFIHLFLCGLGVSFDISAQHKSIVSNLKDNQKRADALYHKGWYSEAAELYESILEKRPGDETIERNIALCYAHLNQPNKVVEWYSKVNPENIHAEHKLSYALALMTLEQYTQAKLLLSQYLQEVPQDKRAANLIDGIVNREQLYKDSANYTIRNLKINSAQNDFGPAFYEKGVAFISGRQDTRPIKHVVTRDQSAFMDLYYAEADETGELKNQTEIHQGINSRYHDGPVCLFDDGRKVIFTRNASSSEEKVTTLKIFEAEKSKDGKSWINVKHFQYNSHSYSVAHPAITNDGNTLYFSSDMSGGHGQSDIYMCHRTLHGWTPPENLGPNINTEGNEIFPFLHHDVLYFSSNGLAGLGGLDVFKVDVTKKNAIPQNLGFPISSSYDDFGLILNDNNAGYFSSNRAGTRNDDLFWVKFKGNAPAGNVPIPYATQIIQGSIYNIESGEPVAHAHIYILNQATGEELEIKADDKGGFEFKARMDDAYAVMGEKEDLSAFISDFEPGKSERVKLAASTPSFNRNIILEVVLRDEKTDEPVRMAKVTLVEGDEALEFDHSSLNGNVYFNGKLAKNYLFKIENKYYVHEGFPFYSKTVPSSDTIKILIPLPRLKQTIIRVQGYVREGHNNKPVANGAVLLLNNTTGEMQTVYSDADGNFTAKANLDDSYTIMAEKADMSALLLNVKFKDPDVNTNEPLQLMIGKPSFPHYVVVEVLVTDKEDSRPLKLAGVHLRGPLREEKVYTDFTGKVYFHVKSDQPITITADLRNYSSHPLHIVPKPSATSDTVDVFISLDKIKSEFITVVGSIEDVTQIPLHQAFIQVFNEVTGEAQVLYSDELGKFEFKARPSDYYMIMGEKDNKSAFAVNLKFDNAGETSSNIKLIAKEIVFEESTSREAVVTISIVDGAEGSPINLAHVSILDNEMLHKKLVSGPNGTVRLRLPKNKKFMVQVDRQDYELGHTALDIQSTLDSLELMVKMIKHVPVVLRGNIHDVAENAVVPNADIYILNETTGHQQKVISDTKGNFEFQAHEEHSYTILTEKDDKSVLLSSVKAEALKDNKVQLNVSEGKKQPVIVATVVDSKSENPLQLAAITLRSNMMDWQTSYSSQNGKSVLAAIRGRSYTLDVTLRNYEPTSLIISSAQLASGDTIQTTVRLNRVEPIKAKQPVLVYESNTGNPVAAAKIYVLNEATGEEQYLVADSKGFFAFNATLHESYALLAEKDDLMAFMVNVRTDHVGVNLDTIHVAVNSPGKKNIILHIEAVDKTSKERVKMVLVNVLEGNNVKQSDFTRSDGTIVFVAKADKDFVLSTVHSGYNQNETHISTRDFEKDTLFVTLDLQKAKLPYTTLRIQTIDDKTNAFISDAIVKIVNEQTKDEQQFLTDKDGIVEVKVKYGERYTVMSQGNNKTAVLSGVVMREKDDSRNVLKLVVVDTEPREDMALIAKDVKLIEVWSGKEQLFVDSEGTLFEYVTIEGNKALQNRQSKKILAQFATNTSSKGLYEEFINYVNAAAISSRAIIRNVYFSYDNHELTEEALQELTVIVNVMKEYEDVQIRISAYADNRGTNSYNMTLTQKRADAIFHYLLSQGIEQSRIKHEARGEEKLIKPCPVPKNCSEEDHQVNRRAEFILSFR